MTLQQLKRELAEIRGTLKPGNLEYLIIIYDHKIRGDSENAKLESILKINGKDVSHLSIEEKEKMLSVDNVHLYLPKKDPYPGDVTRIYIPDDGRD
jgi:hypothetical protein